MTKAAPKMPSKGDLAPDFTLPRNGGGDLTLSEIRGKIVLYFYPKDSTPGCTLEANDFSRLADEFIEADTTVIGISKDSVASHDRFCTKQNLRVILVSDANGTTCEDYGVWAEKLNFGKSYMGILRSTFLIKDGKIAEVWPKVSVKGHAEAVLDAARAL